MGLSNASGGELDGLDALEDGLEGLPESLFDLLAHDVEGHRRALVLQLRELLDVGWRQQIRAR